MKKILKSALIGCLCLIMCFCGGCEWELPATEQSENSAPSSESNIQQEDSPVEEKDEQEGSSAEELAQKEKEEEERQERQDRIDAIEAMLNDPFMVLVNRDHKLSSDFAPSDRVSFRGGYPLNKTCAEQLGKLVDAGKAAGYHFVLYSGYRTYSSQYNKYYNKIAYYEGKGYSNAEAVRLTDLYYAPPGASEHQTGLAADVCIPSIVNKYGELHDAYAETAEFKWFSTHAHEYGFILRYRLGDEDITGYAYEPWHYRYVGVEAAKEIYRLDITYEEYIEGLQKELADLKAAN